MKTVTSQVHMPRERMKGRIVRSQRVRNSEKKGSLLLTMQMGKTQPPFRSGMRRITQSPGVQRVATETRLAQRAKRKTRMTGSTMFLKGISTTTADREKRQTAERTRHSAGVARRKRIRRSVKVKANTGRHSQQNRTASPKRTKRDRLFQVRKKQFQTTPVAESIQPVKTRAASLEAKAPNAPSPWWTSSPTRIYVLSRESSWPNAENRLPVLGESAETADSELPADLELPFSPHMEYSFPEPCDMSGCALIGEPWNLVMTVFSGDYRIPDEDILLVLMEGLQGAEDTEPATELDLSAIAIFNGM